MTRTSKRLSLESPGAAIVPVSKMASLIVLD
jgi:hypothetical protein